MVPTDASGWRSTVRRSIARLVPHPGQNTSSHGVPASSAALRPQHVTSGRQPPIPAIDHGLGFGARSPVGSELGRAGFDVWSACPDAHPASIRVPAE
jgi:hypothetical protein